MFLFISSENVRTKSNMIWTNTFTSNFVCIKYGQKSSIITTFGVSVWRECLYNAVWSAGCIGHQNVGGIYGQRQLQDWHTSGYQVSTIFNCDIHTVL